MAKNNYSSIQSSQDLMVPMCGVLLNYTLNTEVKSESCFAYRVRQHKLNCQDQI